MAAFNDLSGRLDIINGFQEGLMDESLRNVHLDVTDYQAWVDGEADRAISDVAVKITSAADGVALTNYCKLTMPILSEFKK